ncbi:putative pentatricopeptide repeat-containing protein [Camellia lanceoleosa]|uniref:Pentatricopeptide repeat-containing protein n=1 Tax=Camellia lanceoleosa TaxID=1840588 RepID=A0ACC0HZG6_9ERIC|nr:putative pentatricopeptide repeat-containing protein [Camellia lanceoleosa]
MLIGILDGFQETEFCYVDRGIIVGDTKDDFEFGKQVHIEVVKVFSLSNEFLGTHLLRMYSQAGDMDSVKKVFDEMPIRDFVIWNALIFCYSKCGMGDVGVELFRFSLSVQSLFSLRSLKLESSIYRFDLQVYLTSLVSFAHPQPWMIIIMMLVFPG